MAHLTVARTLWPFRRRRRGQQLVQRRQAHFISRPTTASAANAFGGVKLDSTVDFSAKMGIEGLWEFIRPAEGIEDFSALTIRRALLSKPPARMFRLGVDISIWLHQAQNTFAVGHTQSGENPELKMVFSRFARLFELPILVTVVFDGAHRPRLKRGRKLAEAFGFTCHTAPGEAEAELAKMQRNGLIDAIYTNDSDAFAFGADMVIRVPTLSKDKNNVKVYSTDAIRKQMQNSLSREDFILMALLSGGDYDPNGVAGFGCKTAAALARYGLGHTLVDAADLPPELVHQYLISWRKQARNYLCNDHNGYLTKRSPSLAETIPEDFPDMQVLRAYTHPNTSSSAVLFAVSLKTKAAEPDITKLAQLCEQFFQWGYQGGILARFRDSVWPGVVRRRLWNVDVLSSGIMGNLLHTIVVASRTVRSRRLKHITDVPLYTIQVPVSALREQTIAALRGTREVQGLVPTVLNSSPPKRGRLCAVTDPLDVWIPASILESIGVQCRVGSILLETSNAAVAAPLSLAGPSTSGLSEQSTTRCIHLSDPSAKGKRLAHRSTPVSKAGALLRESWRPPSCGPVPPLSDSLSGSLAGGLSLATAIDVDAFPDFASQDAFPACARDVWYHSRITGEGTSASPYDLTRSPSLSVGDSVADDKLPSVAELLREYF